MIKILKEKGYEIREPDRLLKVQLCDKKYILLKDKYDNQLVETWDSRNFLNYFKYFKENNLGHFCIKGQYNKFEFFYKGKWVKYDEEMGVRFLDKNNKFLEVNYGDRKDFLLEDKSSNVLVITWYYKLDLNNFKTFKKYNLGHFLINGDTNKFEFLYKNRWLICDERMSVRFLK